MKDLYKKFVAGILACCMVLPLAACGGGESQVTYYNNDEDPIRFSTLSVDGVFNPFFASSGPDSSVVSYTQIGMIGNDANGDYTFGDDEGVLVKDLEIRTEGTAPAPGADDNRLTTYYFVLKNNVKFSDGKPVTIKDVLFNLYVYLDKSYTGSSTIYSTDIVGLKEYRTQSTDENAEEKFMQDFNTAANTRMTTLSSQITLILKDYKTTGINRDQMKAELQKVVDAHAADTEDGYKHLVEDFEKAIELFGEELEADWSGSLNSYEDTKFSDRDGKVYEGLLTTDVEAFLLNEQYLTWNKKYARLESSITNDVTELKEWTKAQAIEYIIDDMIPEKMDEVVMYWNTGSTLRTFLVNDALEQYANEHKDDKTFPNISGIKFANGGTINGRAVGANSVVVNGLKDGTKTYAKPEYNSDGSVKDGFNEVLSIQIRGVDPKAIWNFAFAVAPLHYYSDTTHVQAFDYYSNFGLDWNSQSFMDGVIKNTHVGVPMGAGPYMPAKPTGGTDNVAANEFNNGGVIYFERNPYYLLGAPKIKKLRLVIVASNQMLNNLYGNNIDFVEPNAKPETEEELRTHSDINCKTIKTQGYGYIGINASKIAEIQVRRAIMYCIDTSLCVDYYRSQADPIYRSMSTESWAYPKGCTAYYPYIDGPVPADLTVVDPYYRTFVTSKGIREGAKLSPAQQAEFIDNLMYEADYALNDGVYTKGSKVCRYTFTVAGEGTDHPAWTALSRAATMLNGYGFDITVKNDSNALKKLASGKLTVWAAAWSSTIDPDMYQVYHKDSTATSVLNWGYPAIIRDGKGGSTYGTEYDLLETLSSHIEKARTIEDKKKRADIYSEALDIVMQLAIELPTYQRNDLFAYNNTRIDAASLNQNPTSLLGLTSEIHKVSLITEQ